MKLFEFRALIPCHVVVAAESQITAKAEIKRWGHDTWYHIGEAGDPAEFELFEERPIPDDVDAEDVAHVVTTGDS